MHSSHSRNIGIACWDFDPPKGGLGRALKLIAETLREQGNNVRIATPSGGTDTVGAWTRRVGLHPVYSIVLFFRLRRWITRTGRDLLLFPCGPGGVWLLRKPKGCTNIAIVYHTYAQQVRLVHGQWWKRIFLPFERASLRRADHIFCYAKDTKEVIERKYDIDPGKVHLLPQIADLDPWMESDAIKEPGLCICVARLEQRKGIRFLAEMWPEVKKQRPNARLLVVGDGVQSGIIDRLVSRKDLSVERVSQLNQKELIDAVSRAEILLCPSYLEGFGLTAIEAMAAGTIVLASDTDGLRSLIRNMQTGLLLPIGDSTAWAQAAGELLMNPKKGEEMRIAAEQAAREHFSAEHTKRALQECLESL